MNIEIEAKMRLDDPAAMVCLLEKLKATFRGEIHETNTFFDTEAGRLKTSDQGLRIRVERYSDGTQNIMVTHKGPRAHGQLKSRSETEMAVHDAKSAADVLVALGFHPVLSFEKRRRSYMLGDCSVELDTLPHLGDYIEIEGPSEEAVLAVRDKLGLSEQPMIKASYIAMLLTYLNENQMFRKMIRFDESESFAAAK